MTRIPVTLILFYYFIGTICLPVGDFSFGGELAAMYHHCKAHEDKDLTPFDFVTDHLLQIDGMFDKHCNGDRQKPHTPPPLQHHPIQNIISFEPGINQSFRPVFVIENQPFYGEILYNSGFFIKIFHPPLCHSELIS